MSSFFFNPILKMNNRKRCLLQEHMVSEKHGGHGLWTARARTGAVQLEIIWREVKGTASERD